MQNLTITYNFNNNINFKCAKQNTIKVASNQHRKLNFVKEEVMEQIKAGLSISDLAKFYKCNINAIKLFLYKNSLIKELNKKNHSNKKDFNSIEKELTECVKENKKVTEMATYFNLKPVTIIKYLNKSGLTVIMVSHNVESIINDVTHVVYLKDKLEFAGTKEDFLQTEYAKLNKLGEKE